MLPVTDTQTLIVRQFPACGEHPFEVGFINCTRHKDWTGKISRRSRNPQIEGAAKVQVELTFNFGGVNTEVALDMRPVATRLLDCLAENQFIQLVAFTHQAVMESRVSMAFKGG